MAFGKRFGENAVRSIFIVLFECCLNPKCTKGILSAKTVEYVVGDGGF